MSKYTEGFKAKVSKMGRKRVVNVPRKNFKEFPAGSKVNVTKKRAEK